MICNCTLSTRYCFLNWRSTMAGDEWREMNGGNETVVLNTWHSHTVHNFITYFFTVAFLTKWRSIHYKWASDHPLVPRILPCDAVDRGCVHLPAILPTNCYKILFCAQNPNIFHWRISTLCCTDLSPLPERYRVEPSRWGALEEKPSHNLLQPVVRHACAMICVVLEVSVKHVSLLCLTTTGLVASVKYYK